MPPVLAILFWAWLLVSVVVLLRRRSTKRRAAALDGAVDHATAPDDLAAVDAPEPPVPATVGADADTAPPPAATPLPTPPPGFEAPAAPGHDRPARRAAHRDVPAAGVADALVGIRMPCDLVPLVVDRLAANRITLSTTGHAAEDVGTALADEVERLGYVVRPLSDHEVLATRGATELQLCIRPPDADGRHKAHPAAREDSVVVEITLG